MKAWGEELDFGDLEREFSSLCTGWVTGDTDDVSSSNVFVLGSEFLGSGCVATMSAAYRR